MRVDTRLFKSRLAWRFFGTFVACALIPIVLLAVISYYRVTRQLEDQAMDRLRQSAKAHGLSIYERLLAANRQLQMMEEMTSPKRCSDFSALPRVIEDRNRLLFTGLAAIHEGRTVPLSGSRDIRSYEEAIRRNRQGDQDVVLTILEKRGNWPQIAIVRRIGDHARHQAHLVGILKPSFLWGTEEGTVLPTGAEFLVWDDQGRNLFNSMGSPVALDALYRSTRRMPMGDARFAIGDRSYYGFCWSAFLKPHFYVPFWSIMVVESRAYVLSPLRNYRVVFPLVLLLSLVVVAWLSSRAIRKSLVPIDALMAGATHVGAQDFTHHVVVNSKDEFSDLAATFNRMTHQLDVQFKTLVARSDLDRLILSVLDIDLIVTTSLNHLELFFPHRVAAISTTEEFSTTLEGRSLIRELENGHVSTRTEQFSLTPEEHLLLLHEKPPWLLVDASEPCLGYLKTLRRPGVRAFLVLPVWVQDKLFALVSLSTGKETPEQRDLEHLRGFTDHLAVAFANSNLVEELKELQLGALFALARTVDTKSAWTAGHSVRVGQVAADVGKVLMLSQQELNDLQRACLLHDIGKIGVTLKILDKPGKLTVEEYDIVKRHPSLGARILSPIRAFGTIIPAVEQHHERYDGAGYPGGIKGDAIDLKARIISVADAFDAMVSDRPYRNGLDRKTAVRIIREESGKQFDPRIVDAFNVVVASEQASILAQPLDDRISQHVPLPVLHHGTAEAQREGVKT